MNNKIEVSYPAVLSADVWLSDFKVKLVNFNVEFVAPLKKWAVAKAKAFLLDKINEYVASTGKTVSDFVLDFPPCTKEQLVDFVCEGEVIGVISDRYNQKTGKFSVNTMYDIEEFFEIKPQIDDFSVSDEKQEKIVQISYNSIYNEDEAEERGEARIKLVNFDEEFEDMSWQNVYTKTMTFLLDKINEYRKSTGKSASEFMASFPSSTKEELLPLLKEGERIVEICDDYNEKTKEFSEGVQFFIDRFRR